MEVMCIYQNKKFHLINNYWPMPIRPKLNNKIQYMFLVLTDTKEGIQQICFKTKLYYVMQFTRTINDNTKAIIVLYKYALNYKPYKIQVLNTSTIFSNLSITTIFS